MKREKQNSRSSNNGFSLIELIVTILISSVVMLAVVGFLSSGLRHFQNVNSETLLQMESQSATLFLTELFQESTDFRVIESAKYPEGISYAVEVQRDGACVLALMGNELWFSKVTEGGSDSAKLNELQTKGRQRAFLAKYVDSFQIGTNSQSFAQAASYEADGGCGLVSVKVTFQVGGKEYYSNSVISLRNTKKN